MNWKTKTVTPIEYNRIIEILVINEKKKEEILYLNEIKEIIELKIINVS